VHVRVGEAGKEGTGRQRTGRADRQPDRQADRQADREVDREADRGMGGKP
jgi:hypothetical protein